MGIGTRWLQGEQLTVKRLGLPQPPRPAVQPCLFQ